MPFAMAASSSASVSWLMACSVPQDDGKSDTCVAFRKRFVLRNHHQALGCTLAER